MTVPGGRTGRAVFFFSIFGWSKSMDELFVAYRATRMFEAFPPVRIKETGVVGCKN
jgi:hypothetical protein